MELGLKTRILNYSPCSYNSTFILCKKNEDFVIWVKVTLSISVLGKTDDL